MDNLNEKTKDIIELARQISKPCTEELDDYMSIVNGALLDKDNLTTPEVETMIMNLPTLIYFVISKAEEIGIQEDFAKMAKGETYSKALEIAQGKVDEKKAQAEVAAATDTIIHCAYSRAYKSVKGRVDAAYEVLNSLKKVYTMRIAEAELSNNKFSGRRGD